MMNENKLLFVGLKFTCFASSLEFEHAVFFKVILEDSVDSVCYCFGLLK